MKKSIVLLAAFVSVSTLPAVRAQEIPKPVVSELVGDSATADLNAFRALVAEKPPGLPKEMGNEKYYTWVGAQRDKIAAAGLAFYEKYSSDPRRWEVLMTTLGQAPLFIKSLGPDVETRGMSAAVIDQEAKAAWEAKGEVLRKALLASADAAPMQKEAVDWYFFAKDFRATSAAKNKKEPFDYGPFHPRFDAHAAKYASLPNLPARARDYLGALESNMPGAGVKEWKYLLDSPNESLRTTATEQLAKIEQDAARKVELKTKPLEIAFTAVDGRQVDLKNLRGKVVLVDFWATWCGPCIAELPNIKKVYAAYHDKGFEIVGISLENGRLLPADTANQTADKMAKAAKVLTDFTTKEAMPWPQHFDGKYWKNDISTRFAINSIPAMFLLDQEGKVVSTNARGPKLEEEVKRLLKL